MLESTQRKRLCCSLPFSTVLIFFTADPNPILWLVVVVVVMGTFMHVCQDFSTCLKDKKTIVIVHTRGISMWNFSRLFFDGALQFTPCILGFLIGYSTVVWLIVLVTGCTIHRFTANVHVSQGTFSYELLANPFCSLYVEGSLCSDLEWSILDSAPDWRQCSQAVFRHSNNLGPLPALPLLHCSWHEDHPQELHISGDV